MTSSAWTHNNGAPLLPKVSPYCIPVKMMELKRRPTIYDIRGSGWQLRHKNAKPGDEVPWERVFFWPPKAVHVITDQELYKPDKRRRKRAAKKGPKVVKAPATPARDRKFAAKFVVHFDFQRVLRYLDASADKRAVKAASADAAKAPTTRSIFSRPLVPGAFPNDDDDAAAADVDAQAQSAADDKAQPSLLAAVFNFAFGLFFGRGTSKRAHEDDDHDETGDAKRRRIRSDAQAPSRAEARPAAGKATRSNTTGATAPTYHKLTTNAAQRRARNVPKASLTVCPPPSGSASVAGNAKVVEALLMPPPLARPIAGRPMRKRADTPDPRAGTPPPSASQAPADPEASSALSTPTSSPSSSRASSPEPSQSPAPAPKEESSKSKPKSTKSKSSKSKSQSSSSESQSSSSDSESSSSESESSSSKAKSKSKSKSKSSSISRSSSSKSQPSSAETKPASKSTPSTSKSKPSPSDSQSSSSESDSSSSESDSSSSESRSSRKSSSRRSSTELAAGPGTRHRSGVEIMLYPHFISWTREEEKLVNPWDPRCPAAPDPRWPWAPTNSKWAQARPAPITLSSSTAASTISFQHPASIRDRERAPPTAMSSARRDCAASPALEELSGDETEVESGGEETDDEED